ncbi:g9639 [Coccomyxa elongata]
MYLSELAGGTAAQKYTKSQCRWGLPVVAPANRSGDTWGLGWDKLLEVEVIDVETADAMEGYDILFYGDSITENWRGTSGGLHWRNWDGTLDTRFIAADMRAVYLNTFAYKYRTGVMAIAGDQIGHLWWRMLHGQFPVRPPKVAVVLIGTNDLYAVSECTQNSRIDLIQSVQDIISRFAGMVKDMKKAMPGTQIIVEGVLPRGADFASGQYVYPNNFTTAVSYLNAEYQRMALEDPVLHYIYCGNDFLTPTSDGIASEVMPDGLHPNAAGLKLIAQCLTPLIEKLMHSNSTQQIASAVSTLDSVTSAQGIGTPNVLALNGAAGKPGYVAAAAQASFQEQQNLP